MDKIELKTAALSLISIAIAIIAIVSKDRILVVSISSLLLVGYFLYGLSERIEKTHQISRI